MSTTCLSLEYISAAETARLVRAALRRAFPGVPFRVRTHTYAGGASVDVSYAGIVGMAPLASCFCPSGPTLAEHDPRHCTACGHMGRAHPIYAPGMPTRQEVEAVALPFAGSLFDGSIDLAVGRTIFLDAAGNVVGAATRGTVDSRGTIESYDDADTHRVATRAVRAVRPGADYISVNADRRS